MYSSWDSTFSYISISLYYDDKLKRWVDPNADPNEADGSNAPPPPTDKQLIGASNAQSQLSTNPTGANEQMPPPFTGNKFAGRYMHCYTEKVG